MEQSNDSTFEFSAASGVDRCRTECFPDDGLTNIRRNKQRDARAKTVAFLKEFIEQKDDETGDKQLNDNQKTNASANVRGIAVPMPTDDT